jgi:hypothetical protein
MIGKYYQDVMDPTRFVVPVSNNKNMVRCRVFFRDKSGRLDFAGLTDISGNLFTGTKYDPGMPERIGFVLADR